VPAGCSPTGLVRVVLLVIIQLWRAGCLMCAALCRRPGLVHNRRRADGSRRGGDPVTHAGRGGVGGTGRERVRTMAVLRSTRNVGFSAGALLAVPLIAAGSATPSRRSWAGDAASFAVAALLLARLPAAQAEVEQAEVEQGAGVKRAAIRPSPGFWPAAVSFPRLGAMPGWLA